MIDGERYASREEFSKVRVEFESDGVDCEGWLYRPDRPRDPPIVVMGPGLAAERTFGYPAYAERLAAAGYAAFLFDYRGFGASGGDPRGLVSVRRQLDDWSAALARVRHLNGVDTDRVAVWGASLAGGHALRLAASDHRVDAVVAQSPMVDGRAVLRANGPRWLARAFAASARDRLGGLLGRRHRIPVVPELATTDAPAPGVTGGGPDLSAGGAEGEDDEGGLVEPDPTFALLPHRDLASDFRDLVPLRSDWENSVPARAVGDLWGYRPAETVAGMTVPTLLLTGSDDQVVPVESVTAAAATLPESSLVTLPTGHLDLFESPWRERALGHQLTFLDGALRGE